MYIILYIFYIYEIKYYEEKKNHVTISFQLETSEKKNIALFYNFHSRRIYTNTSGFKKK